jgi:RNA polymerase sigma factor (sigma-70 family)
VNEALQRLRQALLRREGDELTDGQLLECFVRGGDAVALELLVRRHGPMVWGVCRRVLPSHHDAEDAFQATFLVLVRKAASVRSRELLANWLYGVAHRTALKARQTAAKRHAREKQGMDVPEPAARQEGDAWGDLRLLLDEGLSRLPDRYRAVVVLCDLEGKGRAEAARRLGLPEGTVASRLARARALLAKLLARHGAAVGAGVLAAVLAREASAAVPPAVLAGTVKAATGVAAGEAAAGLVSARVVALAEGVLKAMGLTKLKAVVVAAAVGVLLLGGVLSYRMVAAPPGQPEKRPPDEAKADRPAEEGKDRGRTFKLDGAPQAAALSPDGKLMVVALQGTGRVCVLDAATGETLRTIEMENREQAGRLVFTPDGKGVVAPTGGATADPILLLWDVTTGREVRRFTGHTAATYDVALSPDGKRMVSASADRTPRLWDVATGKELGKFEGHTDWVLRAAFSPDNVTVATGCSDKTVRLWDTKTCREIRTLDHGGPDHDGQVYGVAFSPDGTLLASVGGSRLVLWDVATGKELRELNREDGRWVAFSPDGTLLASGGSPIVEGHCPGVVHLWEVASGQNLTTYTDHDNGSMCGGFSPDGRVLYSGGCNDMTIRFRDLCRPDKEDVPRELTAERLRGLWKELTDADAAAAFEAARVLSAAPKQSVPFLREVLRPEAPSEVTPERVARWIADLDSDEFAVRTRAAAELSRNARQAEPLLRKALEAPASAEAKRRLEQIVAGLDRRELSPERLQALRGLGVLERVATPEAAEAVERLTRGPEGAWLTKQARKALERMQPRKGER